MMTDRLILGKGVEFSTDSYKTKLNNNVALIGCTGSGKTLHYIQPMLLDTYERNLIINDPKRELVGSYKGLFESRGYKVVELNLADTIGGEYCFDPLIYANSHSEILSLAKSLVNLCKQSENSSADRFWADASVNLAAFGLYYVIDKAKTYNKKPKLNDFLSLIDNITLDNNGVLASTNYSDYAYVVQNKDPNDPIATYYNAFACNPVRTAGCILGTLKTTLTDVFNRDIRYQLENNPSVDIRELAKEKSVLFITSDGSNEFIDAYVNLIFEIIIRQLINIANEQENGVLPYETHLIMDDFACGTKIESFPKMISLFRSKGIASTIVLQSESQLSDLYGSYASHTILNNNDTIVYLGGNDIDTANDFASRLDVSLQDVLYMPIDKTMIFRRGMMPKVVDKYPTLEDERFIALNKKESDGLKIRIA